MRTGFVGSDNFFDRYICSWLREHSDLRLIVWTDQLRWAAKPRRWRKVVLRYQRRAKRYGWLRVADEVLYYALYRTLLRHDEARKLRTLIEQMVTGRGRGAGLEDVRQIRPTNIRAPAVLEAIREEQLDALLSLCLDILLPEALISAPRLGSYLWHEGITPEYRGVYPAFWALANGDYGNLGYTFLRMNMKVDSGDVFVQGTVRDVDPLSDWHSYIGHKAVLDSLDETELFLGKLERGEQRTLERAVSDDRLYSYPTASAFMRIVLRRQQGKSGS